MFSDGLGQHRYRHSGDSAEAKNFGAVVSVWDPLFGTFEYRPAETPRALGIDDPTQYPADTQLWTVLALPLSRSPSVSNQIKRQATN